MELIYMYVEDFEERIKDIEYNFSSKYKVRYCREVNELKLEIHDGNKPDKFFGENIKNITAIVGKNGAGKTSILEILDRKDFFFHHINDNYILLYYVDNNIFYLETVKRILNRLYRVDLENENKLKGIYLEFKNGVFIPIIKSEESIRTTCFIKTQNNNSITTPYNNGNIIDRNIMKYGWEQRYKFLIHVKSKSKLYDAYRNVKNIIININSKYRIKTQLGNFINIKSKSDIRNRFTEKQIFIIQLLVQQIKRLCIEVENYYKEDLNNRYRDIEKQIIRSLELKETNNYNFIIEDLIKTYIRLFKEIDSNRRHNIDEETNLNHFINIIIKLDAVDEINFDKGYLNIDLTDREDKKIVEFLKALDGCSQREYADIRANLDIKVRNLSDGENEFIDTFVGIHSSLDNYKDIILILDEPDKSFHPEWSRRFITYLIENLEIFDTNQIKRKYQIILTTHSPFIVSDLPKENILTIEDCKTKDIDLGNTFGANIHMLLSNQFFMESTIGEFARQKINKCILELNKRIKDSTYEIDDENKVEIEYIIKNVGEPIIKNKLANMYKEAFPSNEDDYIYKIKRLEEEKYKLENLLKDKKIDNIDEVMDLLKRQIDMLKKKSGENK